MRPKSFKALHVSVTLIAVLSAACGDFARQSRSPSQLVIVRLETPAVEFREIQGGTGVPGTIVEIQGFRPGPLYSDVDPARRDLGRVVLGRILRDPGAPGAATAPTPINDITVTEYDVKYRLADGRNTPGVDVPYPIRGALTISVQSTTGAVGDFELVRPVAKLEPPLAALRDNTVVLTTIADVTFYGRDQAGNTVSATGSVQVNFADF